VEADDATEAENHVIANVENATEDEPIVHVNVHEPVSYSPGVFQR
jgi:hypothetical protein